MVAETQIFNSELPAKLQGLFDVLEHGSVQSSMNSLRTFLRDPQGEAAAVAFSMSLGNFNLLKTVYAASAGTDAEFDLTFANNAACRFAASFGRTDILQWLQQSGQAIDFSANENEVFHNARLNGRTDAAEWLLQLHAPEIFQAALKYRQYDLASEAASNQHASLGIDDFQQLLETVIEDADISQEEALRSLPMSEIAMIPELVMLVQRAAKKGKLKLARALNTMLDDAEDFTNTSASAIEKALSEKRYDDAMARLRRAPGELSPTAIVSLFVSKPVDFFEPFIDTLAALTVLNFGSLMVDAVNASNFDLADFFAEKAGLSPAVLSAQPSQLIEFFKLTDCAYLEKFLASVPAAEIAVSDTECLELFRSAVESGSLRKLMLLIGQIADPVQLDLLAVAAPTLLQEAQTSNGFKMIASELFFGLPGISAEAQQRIAQLSASACVNKAVIQLLQQSSVPKEDWRKYLTSDVVRAGISSGAVTSIDQAQTLLESRKPTTSLAAKRT